MNSMHSNGERDRSLHEALDKLGRSYAQLDTDEPPELLDMAVLNSARRAVEKRPRRMKFGWAPGLTTAAVFVLALSLIVHQRSDQPLGGNGIQIDKLERARVESPSKKDSIAVQSGQLNQESKASADERMGQPEPAAAAAAPAAREPAPGDTSLESRLSTSDDHGQLSDFATIEEDKPGQAKTGSAKNADVQALKEIERLEKPATANEIAEPAATAGPQTPAAEAQGMADTQAEAQLRVIIGMKQDGDERWKTELEAFIESHPGYPLPDELKN